MSDEFIYHRPMIVEKPFSIGDPGNPTESDWQFDTYEQALAVAETQEGVTAIWENESGEILALVFEGIEYR